MDRMFETFTTGIVTDAATGCWLWTRDLNEKGYAKIVVPGKQRRVRASRYAYQMFCGPIPDGLTIDHLCSQRRCVNPSHLEAVSHRENVDRATRARTHCRRGHLLSHENVRLVIRGKYVKRDCRTCHNWTANHPRCAPAAKEEKG